MTTYTIATDAGDATLEVDDEAGTAVLTTAAGFQIQAHRDPEFDLEALLADLRATGTVTER